MHSLFKCHRTFASIFLATAVFAIAGCGKSRPERVPVVKVAGTISFRNQTLDGAFVVLHPQSAAASAPRPTAHVKPDGTFEPTTFDARDGAPAGKYIVTVEWHKLVKVAGEWTQGPNLLPAKYASPQSSDVYVTVAEGTSSLPAIVLR